MKRPSLLKLRRESVRVFTPRILGDEQLIRAAGGTETDNCGEPDPTGSGRRSDP